MGTGHLGAAKRDLPQPDSRQGHGPGRCHAVDRQLSRQLDLPHPRQESLFGRALQARLRLLDLRRHGHPSRRIHGQNGARNQRPHPRTDGSHVAVPRQVIAEIAHGCTVNAQNCTETVRFLCSVGGPRTGQVIDSVDGVHGCTVPACFESKSGPVCRVRRGGGL